MPPSNDFGTGKRGSIRKKDANCSFCRKSYRDVGPLVEGPDDVYICGSCIELCESILDQEKKRRGGRTLFKSVPAPREIVSFLDQYVIGQEHTKRVLAVAVQHDEHRPHLVIAVIVGGDLDDAAIARRRRLRLGDRAQHEEHSESANSRA